MSCPSKQGTRYSPTEHSTISEPQNPTNDVSERHNAQSPAFEAWKLWNVRSGSLFLLWLWKWHGHERTGRIPTSLIPSKTLSLVLKRTHKTEPWTVLLLSSLSLLCVAFSHIVKFSAPFITLQRSDCFWIVLFNAMTLSISFLSILVSCGSCSLNERVFRDYEIVSYLLLYKAAGWGRIERGERAKLSWAGCQ